MEIVCSGCGQQKPSTEFPNVKKQGKMCRGCLKAKHAKYYAEHKQMWVDREKRLREADPEGLSKRQREAQLRYRAKPDYSRILRMQYIKKRYGLSLEEYEVMLQKQAGVCRLCGKPPFNRARTQIARLHVDHCHVTGKIRGLLCFHCNAMLGNAQDDVGVLKRAIAYLEGVLD